MLLGHYRIFTTNGTFIAPSGITRVRVLCVGGGAGGGVGRANGGGSGWVTTREVLINPSHPYEVQVGVGGHGGHSYEANTERNGGNTRFAHLLFASGGQGSNGGSGGG